MVVWQLFAGGHGFGGGVASMFPDSFIWDIIPEAAEYLHNLTTHEGLLKQGSYEQEVSSLGKALKD